ncbi:molybdopterin-dependent oxidoreductase [bacterium]|nr:molybdopterin-dependent oxidoreductase [bacterium]
MAELKRTVCAHDCPDQCGMIVKLENGKIIGVDGDTEHPITNGFLCGKVKDEWETVYSDLRVKFPMKRVGKKGEGRFERISWDEALKTIKKKFHQTSENFGSEAILPFSYAGNMGLLARRVGDRFFYRLGASRLDRTICSTASEIGTQSVLGAALSPDWRNFTKSKFIVVWGGNIASSNVHLVPFFKKAQDNGAEIFCIDPQKTRTAKISDFHVPLRPGTDTALALGIIREIIKNKFYDENYVKNFTNGFDELAEACESFTLQKTSEITDVYPKTIQKIAKKLYENQPSVIKIGIGMSRQLYGATATRTILAIPCLLGSWQKIGGGATLESADVFKINKNVASREDLASKKTRKINMVELGKALTEIENPPVKMLFVWNSNPAVVVPNSAKVIQGLLREDLFTVVHERIFSDTTKYADLLLPSTIYYENTDFYKSYGHNFAQMTNPVVPPQFEAKSNFELFQTLAKLMDFQEDCFNETEHDLIKKMIAPWEEKTFDDFKNGKCVQAEVPNDFQPFADGKFFTPSGKAELWDNSLVASPGYKPSFEGHESPKIKKFPLQLISGIAHNFLNTSFGESQRNRKKEKTVLKIHPADAKKRLIENGDTVRIFSENGACLLTAELTEDVREGLVVSEALFWNEFTQDGKGINFVTSDKLTDFGGCSTVHANLVEVQKFLV